MTQKDKMLKGELYDAPSTGNQHRLSAAERNGDYGR